MTTGGYLQRPAPSGLADVIEIILDKGIVIDAYARVSVVGIEILTVDARVVVASVDTYLRFAEATNRLDLHEHGGRGLPEIVEEQTGRVIEKVASNVVEKKVSGTVGKVEKTVGKTVGKTVSKTKETAGKVGRAASKVADAVTPEHH